MYNIPTTGLGDSFEGLTEPKLGSSVGQGALQMGVQGASIGAAFGGIGAPIGAGIGLLAGGVMGLLQGNQEKKAYENSMLRAEQARKSADYMRQRQQGISALDSINQGQYKQRIGYTDMFNL